MRIGVLTCAYPPYRAGIGNVAERQAHMLAEGGHDVEVLCPAEPGQTTRTVVEGAARVTRLRPFFRHGNSALLPTIGRRLTRFDAIYLHYPFFGGAEIGSLAARARGIPYLAYFHMDVVGGGAKGVFLNAYARAVAPRILRGARRVLVSSLDYVQHSTIAGYGLTNMLEVPYSVDESVYSPQEIAPQALQAHGISPGERFVLFVGAMDGGHRFKGIPELISAFSRAQTATPCRLVLVGDGDLRHEYEQMAQAASPERITFLGKVDEALLVALYRAAWATVLPSVTREEAFGVVLIESMACGTPVLASDLPGVRSVFRNGEEGLLVAPGDVEGLRATIERIVADRGLRDSLAAGALAAARTHYTRSRERDTLLQVFSEIGRCPSETAP